jgi:N utilization substance protein B
MTVSRRQARRDAMVVLYQQEITGSPTGDLFISLEAENEYEADEFTRDTVTAVLNKAEELDEIIDSCSDNWSAKRMAPLERSILRIAVNEIIADESIPAEVSIDEAVALAKRFCSREAAALINGILGKLAEESPGDESP